MRKRQYTVLVLLVVFVFSVASQEITLDSFIGKWKATKLFLVSIEFENDFPKSYSNNNIMNQDESYDIEFRNDGTGILTDKNESKIFLWHLEDSEKSYNKKSIIYLTSIYYGNTYSTDLINYTKIDNEKYIFYWKSPVETKIQVMKKIN